MFCARFNATIPTRTCLRRQEINRRNHVSKNGKKGVVDHATFPACVGCKQGKEIKKAKGIDHDMDIEQLRAIHQEVKKPFAMAEVAKPHYYEPGLDSDDDGELETWI